MREDRSARGNDRMSRASSEGAHGDRRIRGGTLSIVNGRIWARPDASAVLVDGDRIKAIGIAEFSASRVIDAGGLAVISAFNDAHVHFLEASRSLGQLDLFGAATQAEVERRIHRYASAH